MVLLVIAELICVLQKKSRVVCKKQKLQNVFSYAYDPYKLRYITL